MHAGVPEIAGGWISRKLIFAYALGSFLFLTSAAVLKVLPTDSLADFIFSHAPRPSNGRSDELIREKTREAVAKLPAILIKLGIALLGVAGVVRLVRSIEPAVVDGGGSLVDEPEKSSGRRGPFRVFDWAVPATLAVLVLVQLAPMVERPLFGDELDNYEEHLTLPLTGTLTTMGGANNQLGFSILAWASIRVFGDSPISVRLPAILGAVLLPVVAYRYGLKEFGRSGATVLGLLLALWPDTIMAGIQGRSYSLLMLFAIVHVYYFKRFALGLDRKSAWLFAVTLALNCTFHMWFVILAAAELIYLGLLKVADWLGWGGIGVRTPLRVETFLLFMTLGGLGAATVQAGIMPKFLFILTQKAPKAIDAANIFGIMGECLQGTSMGTETVPLAYQNSWSTFALRTAVNLVGLVGLLACIRGAWKDLNARFLVGFTLAVAATFFVVVYLQKPVYLYARFFLVLPMIAAWSAARGWSLLLEPKTSHQPIAARSPASTIPA
jgi:Dolichyl-phosphate-mannose-protein mannosyltransferase